jgi:GAF domain-containing protein
MEEELLLSRSAKLAHLKRALRAAQSGLSAATSPAACFKAVVDPFARVPNYDWFGYYRLDGRELVLDYFLGEPTEHVRIPVGTGVCGSAVAKGKNLLVEDVRQVRNYLVCSIDVRSEIVVLVRDPATGKVQGELDADSHQVAAFDEIDESVLSEASVALGTRLAELSKQES